MAGKSPTITAGICRVGTAEKACVPIEIPIQMRIAIPASTGMAQANKLSDPVRQMTATKIAFKVEYPALAPIAFQPGCPM